MSFKLNVDTQLKGEKTMLDVKIRDGEELLQLLQFADFRGLTPYDLKNADKVLEEYEKLLSNALFLDDKEIRGYAEKIIAKIGDVENASQETIRSTFYDFCFKNSIPEVMEDPIYDTMMHIINDDVEL